MQNPASACPYCGAQISANAQFCKSCGKPITAEPTSAPRTAIPSAERRCPNCNAALSETAQFCKRCGKPVGSSTVETPSIAPAVPALLTPAKPTARPRSKQLPLALAGSAALGMCVCAVVVSLLFVWFGKDSLPRGQSMSSPLLTPRTIDSRKGTVGSEGGSITFGDRVRLVIPPGALAQTTDITINKLDPSDLIRSSHTQGVVLDCRGATTLFQKQVELRVPLPDGVATGKTRAPTVWLVDESTGGMTSQPSVIQTVDGKPELVVQTQHFSTYLFEWFSESPPQEAPPLQVPYYSQGTHGVCWAASMQMISEAAKHSYPSEELFGVIGFMNIGLEDGMSMLRGRWGANVDGYVSARTGKRPIRKIWLIPGSGEFNDLVKHIKWELGVEKRPVLLLNSPLVSTGSPYEDHAYVFVGYDAKDNFWVHNPTTLGSNVAYTLERRDTLHIDSAGNGEWVAISIPQELATDRPPVTVNIMDSSLEFLLPPGATTKGDKYQFKWDPTVKAGYSFRSSRDGQVVDKIPYGVTRFNIINSGGGIEIVNATWPQVSQKVSAVIDIESRDSSQKRYQKVLERQLAPGGMWKLQSSDLDIDVNEFYAPAAAPTEYLFTVRVKVGGKTVDEAEFTFVMDSVPTKVEVSVNPSGGIFTATEGQKLTFTATARGIPRTVKAIQWVWEGFTVGEPTTFSKNSGVGETETQSAEFQFTPANHNFFGTVYLYDTTSSPRTELGRYGEILVQVVPAQEAPFSASPRATAVSLAGTPTASAPPVQQGSASIKDGLYSFFIWSDKGCVNAEINQLPVEIKGDKVLIQYDHIYPFAREKHYFMEGSGTVDRNGILAFKFHCVYTYTSHPSFPPEAVETTEGTYAGPFDFAEQKGKTTGTIVGTFLNPTRSCKANLTRGKFEPWVDGYAAH